MSNMKKYKQWLEAATENKQIENFSLRWKLELQEKSKKFFRRQLLSLHC